MTDNNDNLRFNRPSLFTPNLVRGLTEDAAKSSTFTKVIGADLADSVIGMTASFKYDLDNEGLKSTQQLNVDWSKFENHTFFNSAQVKTNVAFTTIVDSFPFDGSQKEYEMFFDRLTGFEKYVFDNYPKYKGYAFFSGSKGSETNAGTWITVKDSAGAAFPNVSKDITGASKLNPGLDSTTIEFWVYLPSGSNTTQTVFSKMSQSISGLDGFSLVVSGTANTDMAPMYYTVASKSLGQTMSFSLRKGTWNNVALIWDRTPNVNQMYAYVNQALTGSSVSFELGETFWDGIDLVIGSGSGFSMGSFTHAPQNTLSGALDDFRIWHSVRSLDDRLNYQKKAVFASDDLRLYFKLNEPSGSNTLLTLDSSGQGLHGQLNIAGNALRVREIPTGSVAGPDPMTYEKLEFTPILFGTHPQVLTFNQSFMVSASNFDDANPNLITKLVPKHYLLEGQVQDGLATEQGNIINTIISGTDPRSAQLGGTQLLLSFAYVWAKYFDEMKLYIQSFSNLNWVDYNSEDTVPDQFLQFMAKQQGFNLPPLFVGSSIEQYINRENIQDDVSTNALSLQYIQNQIWRRILINLQDVVKSKGTIHSVKSFIRSVGIDPDNNFRIREFGGPTKAPLSFVRDKRSEISSFANFVSGGYLRSEYLYQTRFEPGYPFVTPGFTTDAGYLTSGSFTIEGTYRFPKNTVNHVSQGLIRIMNTGSVPGEQALLNVVAVSGSKNITLYTQPTITASASPIVSLVLTGADIFDGGQWYVSYGRQRSDHPDLNSVVSSSYFLRAAKQSFGDITEAYFTSSFFNEIPGGATSVWGTNSSVANASASWLALGSQSLSSTSPYFLNQTGSAPETSRVTYFDGRVGQIRFWSKYLESDEWQEHVRNFKSLGVQNPDLNFNFVTNASGSWERLRLDVSMDQQVTQSDASGQIQFFDYSQNLNYLGALSHFSGSSFPATSSVVVPERFFYSYISPKFDEASTTEKVRPRSFLNYQNVLSSSYAAVAPLYRVELSEQPTDNTRFTIDFSIVDALDQDMVGIFSTLNALDNIIGNPELLFSPDYPRLAFLREVYFNRLTDKMNLKSFFEFYKWFDTNIGTFIAQLIPRKTKYLGTNFVIESHMLERPKLEYLYSDIYLGDNNRHGLKDTILLQLITGDFKRY